MRNLKVGDLVIPKTYTKGTFSAYPPAIAHACLKVRGFDKVLGVVLVLETEGPLFQKNRWRVASKVYLPERLRRITEPEERYLREQHPKLFNQP